MADQPTAHGIGGCDYTVGVLQTAYLAFRSQFLSAERSEIMDKGHGDGSTQASYAAYQREIFLDRVLQQ